MPRPVPSIWPRLLATSIWAFVLLVLSGTLFAWWTIGPLRLQPLLVIVVSVGFRLPLLVGGILVFLMGYTSDLLSGGVIGLQLVAYQLSFTCCVVAERKLEINSWPFEMIAVGLVSLIYQIVVTGGLMLMNHDQFSLMHFPGIALVQALLNALTAPLFFGALEMLVRFFERFMPKKRSSEI